MCGNPQVASGQKMDIPASEADEKCEAQKRSKAHTRRFAILGYLFSAAPAPSSLLWSPLVRRRASLKVSETLKGQKLANTQQHTESERERKAPTYTRLTVEETHLVSEREIRIKRGRMRPTFTLTSRPRHRQVKPQQHVRRASALER